MLDAIRRAPVALIVLRTMLGFTPPEWAYVTSQRRGTEVTQGAVRSLDRKIRVKPLTPLRESSSVTDKRLRALHEHRM